MANGISVPVQGQAKEKVGGILGRLWRRVFPDPEHFNALTIETLKKSERGEDMYEYENFEEYLKEIDS